MVIQTLEDPAEETTHGGFLAVQLHRGQTAGRELSRGDQVQGQEDLTGSETRELHLAQKPLTTGGQALLSAWLAFSRNIHLHLTLPP